MKSRLALYALSLAAVSCGDNSNECGTGTINEDGVCVVDPDVCPDGTVLVGGQCTPEEAVAGDIEEAAEPNGLGLFEASTTSAGKIALKAEGEHFVIHGKIAPFRDTNGDGQNDADIDTYEVEVSEATLLSVTADGVNGLAAGFVSVADVSTGTPLATWQRYGVSLTGDASKRQLYLPAAGKYLIGVGDTRTLILPGGSAGAASGAPEFEYYVTVDKLAAPTPTALTFTDGVASVSGDRNPGEVKLFSAAALGEGVNSVELASGSPQVTTSVAIIRKSGTTAKFLAVGDADNSVPEPAFVSALGFRSTDSAIIVADAVFDYAGSPTDFELTVTQGQAGALPTNNMPVTQPASATDFSVFYYDVLPDSLLIGMNIAFDRPVTGLIVDEDFFIFSLFTYDPDFGFFFGDTFTDYKGHIRHQKPGRYYFVVFDPEFGTTSPPDDIEATSAYAPRTVTPVTKGTPVAGVAVNTTFESNVLTYAAGAATDPWQIFSVVGTGTGTVTLAFADNATAFGRLDPLPSGTCGTFCDDFPTLFTSTHTAALPARERILIGSEGVATFLVTVNTATVTGTPTFDVSFAAAPNVNNLGSPAVGSTTNVTDKPLTGTAAQRYLVKLASGNTAKLTVTPDVAGTDTRIQRILGDGSAAEALVNNGAAGAADVITSLVPATGFMAYVVDKTGADGTVDAAFVNQAPVTYTTAAGTTAFADICPTGSVVAMSDTDEGRSTALISTPTGFDFFGFPATQLRVFANGFLSFDSALACASATSCFFANADMPNAAAPNSLVAPYWDDIILDGVCSKVTGTKLTIQWEGVLYNVTPEQTVQMQAIIDGSNDTIEFVYGAGHTATGAGSTVGIENQGGSGAKKVSFNTAGAAAPTKFSPM